MVAITTEQSKQENTCIDLNNVPKVEENVPKPAEDASDKQPDKPHKIKRECIMAELQRTRLLIKRQEKRRSRCCLFSLLICICTGIVTLLSIQDKFMHHVQRELVIINGMINEKLVYQTEATPSVVLADVVEQVTVSDSDKAVVDVDEIKQSENSQQSDTEDNEDKIVTEAKTDTETIPIIFLDGTESQEDTKKASTKAPESDDVDYHEHKQQVPADARIDFLKMDVVFKIYGYIYAFYVSVIALMIIQFLIVARMLAMSDYYR